jgi:hypothetical protein
MIRILVINLGIYLKIFFNVQGLKFELYNFVLNIISIKKCGSVNAPSYSLKDSNVSLKMKIAEGIEVRTLTHNTLRVEEHAKVPRWGLG